MGLPSIQQTFELALQHHQAGRLKEAEQLYMQVLAEQPDHPDALHLRGVVAAQTGRQAVAVDLLRQAIALRPGFAEAYNNLGNALQAQGQVEQAVAAFRQALVLKPNFPDAYYNLGNGLKDQGQLEQAIAAYRQAIALKPTYAQAHSNLGAALQATGQTDQAIAACRTAIALNPSHPSAHNNLGLALTSKGQLDQAIAACRRAIALQANFSGAYNNLGVALKKKGQREEAIVAYRQAIVLQPKYAEAYGNLGNALQEQGLWEQALAAYRQAIALKPNYAEAYNNLGSALQAQGHLEQAIAAYQQAIRVDPNYAEAYGNLGTAYLEDGHEDWAEKQYRLAIQINPKLATAYNSLGAMVAEAGDFPEAERCYRQAIALAGNDAISHANLARLLGRQLPDKDLAAMQSLLADPDKQVPTPACLHFALAYVLDARAVYGEAAEHLRLANALAKAEAERKGKGYDVAAHTQFITEMIQICSAEFFQRVQGLGLATQRPVFVIGLPRSGTTLVEQILAGHSQVFGAGELSLGSDDFDALAEAPAPATNLHAAREAAFQTLRRIDGPTIQRIAGQHLLRLEKRNSTAMRIVDKMPENYLYLGLLIALFPQARFIHCRRDLRDIAVSCWMTEFAKIPWSHDLEHITSRFEQYRRLMQHWCTVLPGRWLDCDYEQTVADVPAMAHRLLDWCGLEWEPACVDFHLVKRPVRTASTTQVRQPIFSRSVGRWEHYRKTLAPVLARLW